MENEWIILDERSRYRGYFLYHIPCKEESPEIGEYMGLVSREKYFCIDCEKKAPNWIIFQWKLLDR